MVLVLQVIELGDPSQKPLSEAMVSDGPHGMVGGSVLLRPGTQITGDLELSDIFKDLPEVLKRNPAVIFWAWRPAMKQPQIASDYTRGEWKSGTCIIPQSEK